MTRKGGLVAEPTFGGAGLPVKEFCTLVDIITKKHGKNIMITACDKDGYMHFSKDKQHLGYIDINDGSLVWDTKNTKM